MKTRLIGAILAIVLAVVGTVVLTGYVNSADARAANGAEFVEVYLVAAEIPAGTEASAISDLITAKQIPTVAAVPGRVAKLSDLKGLVADTALMPGEQLLESRWVTPAERAASGDVALPEGMQAVSIALPVEQVVGGTVKPGDTVGVVISATIKGTDGAEDTPISRQVFHKVLVTAVREGNKTPPAEGADAAAEPFDTVMVTLARSTADIQKLVWGQEFGSVWLTIEPKTADETGSAVIGGSTVFE
ncbi:Flp pilus assembly protein CpaB [Cryobacterium sp. TMT2-18-3]|uniref:Flp pilus assembly protein CpaB n=1 Tax=unclassified Cryobacterium TaxID=2649013 RepID=UPI00106BD71F|nr:MULTISPECIES: Flp pilus assembly protein CpaB [unclassified Cryobacterium]TFC29454.1 Flp pilus assembly protein CpaB [Cryobacterium sp. TMT2-18-2]TFC37507.1 Flp pilus assembly protein CpaB [Cryobacterium sp. TMT2-42-4]TFC61600.1 Flp pilus assembly protein CpaB [Cryobacterium sp. TMT2-18-3]